MGLFDFLKKNNDSAISSTNITTKSHAIAPDSDRANLPDYVIPVEDRIKNTAPLNSGLYPHEVLLLSYAPKYRCDGKNDYQGFWKHSYGVLHVDKLLASLERRGYLRQDDAMSSAKNMTAQDIKSVLKKYELSQSGKKDVLIQRLADNLTMEQLDAEFPIRHYQLTEMGQKAIDEEPQILYIHKHRDYELNIWSLTKLVHTEPYMNYRDKIWGHLNERGLYYAHNKKFGLYRCIRFSMSEFVAEEGKYENAIVLLFEVIHYDLSWVGNGYDPELTSYYAESFFDFKGERIAPGVMNRVTKYQELLGWSDAELRRKMVEWFDRVKIPVTVLTAGECADIFFAERDNHPRVLSRIYTQAENRFYKR